jgi:putative transposase
VLIKKAFRFQLDPTPEQEDLFRQTVGCVRLVYNLGLVERRLRYAHQSRKSTSYPDQANQLPGLKKAYPWLAVPPAQCLQQALMDLDRAFKNFFAGTHGYPLPRRKYQNDTFRVPQGFTVGDGHITLPKFGPVRYRTSKRIHRVQGQPKSVTVKLEAGRWYASVLCEVHIADPAPRATLSVVGVDRGVALSYATSTGEVARVPQYWPGEAVRRRRLQQKLSRQKKGSANRRKTRAQIARMEARLRRRRLDTVHTFTTHLVQSHGLVAIENLPVQRMTRSARGTVEAPGNNVRQKAGLNRAVLGQLWGEFRRQIEYKAAWYGSEVVKVPAPYTSQTCARCGHVHKDNRIDQATFRCLACGLKTNADLNAALVIHALGVRVYACAVAGAGRLVRQEASVQVLGQPSSASRGSPAGKARQNRRP